MNRARPSDPRCRIVDHVQIRLGCVKYLNAGPLIHGWSGPVVFDHPAALCARLARGEFDIALVSSFEFLRNPIYQIVDGICISSDGPVYSVFVAHPGDISDADQIEIDAASETAVNLLRCLVAELGIRARLATETMANQQNYSRLLIGDQAIRFRQRHENGFDFWDLGDAWKQLVDLPFVYALWLVRPEIVNAKVVAHQLRALRDANLRDIDNLAAQHTEFSPDFCRRYWRENIRFSFGQREKEGLRAFADLCARHGLLPKRDLAFDLV